MNIYVDTYIHAYLHIYLQENVWESMKLVGIGH